MTCSNFVRNFPLKKDHFNVGYKNAALSCQQFYSFQGTRRPEKNQTTWILRDDIVIRGVISLGSQAYHKVIYKLRGKGEIHINVCFLDRTTVC